MLDRDGVLNRDSGYVFRWADWEWLPGAVEALAELKKAGFLLAAVTNQAGVARGYYSEEDVLELHRQVNADLLRRGAPPLDAFYYCPHHPDFSGPCSCRKPAPGLLWRAAEDLNLDLAASFMVGDKPSDVAAGRAAGCRTILLTGGLSANDLSADDLSADDEREPGPGQLTAPDLAAAARLILGEPQPKRGPG